MTNTKRIRILMIEKDLSVNMAAGIIGLDPSNLTAMIRGRIHLYRKRRPLAELLGVELRDIFPDGDRRALRPDRRPARARQ
ncbi:MAG TPA: hypothetical protein VM487_03170 [Phycisphaerae bacterium]|nr:hypothetical protein [Phycisphaerae bacterium]